MAKIIPYPSIETINVDSKRSYKGIHDDEQENYKFYFEEKIDGSQLSILVNNDKLEFYNKHKPINDTNSVFQKAIIMLKCKYQDKNILNGNYIYHGEAVCNLRHNVNVYERTPKYYFIVYDIYDCVDKKYLSLELKHAECDRIGIGYVPVLYHNDDPDCNPYKKAEELIQNIENGSILSCLGGVPEGIVLKHHAFVFKGKTTATKLKYVTNAFKERHKGKQSKVNLSADEFIERLGKEFNTEARFQKAYQHLKENGKEVDIHKIIGELDTDFDKEYMEEIMMLLWSEFSPIIKKHARKDVGEWYKTINL